MRNDLLIKTLVALMPVLVLSSCGTNPSDTASTSNSKQESSISQSSNADPNLVSFPSANSIDQKLNKQYGVSLEYEINGKKDQIKFIRSGEYTRFIDSSEQSGFDVFVRNCSYGSLFYSKGEGSRYTSFKSEELNEEEFYKKAYITALAGRSFKFSSNKETTYLGRPCVEYTYESPSNGSLILDKESMLILHFDIDHLVDAKTSQSDVSSFKFDVKHLYFGEAAKNEISEDIQNIAANPLDSKTFANLGFEGDLETPSFAINGCETRWNEDTLLEYKIDYKDRVNSGNDTYINQFETFTTCLYNLGFSKDYSSSQLVDKAYDELVVDSTVDYDSDITFDAYAVKSSHVYKVSSQVTVKGGVASIKFSFTYLVE